MEVKLRKLWPLLGALCATVCGSAFANSSYSSSESNSNNYGSMDSNMQSGQGSYRRENFSNITPSAGPRVAHGADVFVTANFIWWCLSEPTPYAATGFITSAETATGPYASASKGKYDYVGLDWAPGFKVGLGLNLGHDGWDLYSEYTWIQASEDRWLSKDNGVAYPTALNTFVNAPTVDADKARGEWNRKFNLINLELGRNFYLSQYLTMRPFAGISGTWQSRELKVTVTSDEFTATGNDQTVTMSGPLVQKHDNSVWGIGLRGGLDLGWFINKDWSIYSKFAWSSLWTQYDQLERSVSLDDSTTGNKKTYSNLNSDNLYGLRNVAGTELGICWRKWFSDDSYVFSIQAGWEQQAWLNWVLRQGDLNVSNSDDLSMYGLNLKFYFGF